MTEENILPLVIVGGIAGVFFLIICPVLFWRFMEKSRQNYKDE